MGETTKTRKILSKTQVLNTEAIRNDYEVSWKATRMMLQPKVPRPWLYVVAMLESSLHNYIDLVGAMLTVIAFAWRSHRGTYQ
jgi:hypothetical protein